GGAMSAGLESFDMSATRDATAQFFARTALAAGPVVMLEYERDCAVRAKSDSSPVTVADEKAEALILEMLRAHDPATPIVAEEMIARGAEAVCGRSFILVDPLDGT